MRKLRYPLCLLLVLVPLAAGADKDETTAQRLFHIERNKNANIVVYDAQVLPDGNLPEKDPVDVYWLKLAEDGARKNLNGIEKKMAYGFDVRERDGNRLVLKMKADVGRELTVDAVADTFRAMITIDDRQAQLNRIYIFAEEGGLLPSVKYIEFFGTDLQTKEEVYEKYLP
jgi:hypothetical protein